MNKIKVLRIITRLNVGGPAQHAVILTESLDRARYGSVLVYGSLDRGEGDMSRLLNAATGRFFIPEMQRGINPVADIIALFKILLLIREERPAIVHTHTSKAGTLGRIAAVLSGVPVKVHTFHGHTFDGYFDKLSTAYFLFVERILAYFTDRIVAISGMQKNDLLETYRIGSEKKYSVIKLGLGLDRFLEQGSHAGLFRKRYGLAGDNLLIGIVGRIVPIKNHRMFLRAAKRLTTMVDPAVSGKLKFIIAGDGPLRKEMEDLADFLGLKESVIFTGWADSIEGLYADLDIVALTSLNEGTPLSLIEAQAAGKVIVATDVGGVRDVVGDTAFLVDKDDEAAFAGALADAVKMTAGNRREAGIKGRDRVLRDYSKERLVEDTERLYEILLTEKGINL